MTGQPAGGRHVVVVGGGAIGLMTAYQLVRDGARVTLIDARRTGRGAAEVNAGWVCPAESAPVPGPGMIATSLRWMLRRDSPLYIRPSLQPDFLRFMVGMWRSCNAPTQRAGFEAHLRLAQGTVDAYDAYRDDGVDFELRHDGLLMAFTDPRTLDHHRGHLDLIHRYGLEPRVLLGDDVRSHEPRLSDRVCGGIHLPYEQHLDPPALMRSLHARLLQRGARIVENARIDAVDRRDDRVVGVRSGERSFTADAYVLAAGAWTGPLSRLFGAALPVRPGKGYSIDVAPYGLRGPVNLSDAKVAVSPLTRTLRLAGTMEFGGLDENLNQVRVAAILRAPAHYFRDWQPPDPAAVTPRAGIRPMTPDGLPVIGRLAGLTNAYVCGGHGMQGITLGPGSARALSALVLRGEDPDVLRPFDPARFGRAGSLRARVRGRTRFRSAT